MLALRRRSLIAGLLSSAAARAILVPPPMAAEWEAFTLPPGPVLSEGPWHVTVIGRQPTVFKPGHVIRIDYKAGSKPVLFARSLTP